MQIADCGVSYANLPLLLYRLQNLYQKGREHLVEKAEHYQLGHSYSRQRQLVPGGEPWVMARD